VRNDIASDPSSIDSIFPPEMHPIFIEDRILGLVYVADGKGPHETLVLLHGFPGNEKNLDIAHMLRRGGYNVMVFHYSGSWGSRGTYSFSQDYIDLQSVRACIADASFAGEHRIDRDNVFLAGHSVGGFLTLLAARDGMDFRGFAAVAPYNLGRQAERIEAGDRGAHAETFDLFKGGLKPLNGATAESLMFDILENRNHWDLLSDESRYSGKRILLVMASGDEVAVPEIHQVPVARAIGGTEGEKTIVSLSCSHDFSEKRVALAEALYERLEN